MSNIGLNCVQFDSPGWQGRYRKVQGCEVLAFVTFQIFGPLIFSDQRQQASF